MACCDRAGNCTAISLSTCARERRRRAGHENAGHPCGRAGVDSVGRRWEELCADDAHLPAERGDTRDLFLPVVTLISERLPVAVVLENVPSFGSSLAGQLIVSHLQRLGYHVTTSILEPHRDWAEIEDRRRWVLVATLHRPFTLGVPGQSSTTLLSAFLDPPDPERDRADAERITRTITGLRAHHARHQAAGHGFGFTVVDGFDLKLPVVPKSCHEINTGPFVMTPFGPRLLRQSEIERLHGCELDTRHYGTAVQIMGQGVQTRIFRQLFQQLGGHLDASPGQAGGPVERAGKR